MGSLVKVLRVGLGLSSQLKNRVTPLHKPNRGFTIIEIMIVLAVAALILLVVFLAVPALQRNSRNNNYRSEAARILAGTNEFIANNSNALPVTSVSTTVGSNAAAILANANPKNITQLNVVNPAVAATVTPTLTNAFLETGATCPASAGTPGVILAAANVAPTAPARSLVLIYAVENSSGAVVGQCTSS